MIHGYNFSFVDEPLLGKKALDTAPPCIEVKSVQQNDLADDYPVKRSWMPLSGQEGRYIAKVPFEEADENFSWALEIKNVLTLFWEPKEKTIYYHKEQDYTPERLEFWIYHTFFPISLELNRIAHFLHVGAVEIKGKTLLFSAPSFGGKSTLTDHFIKQGATLISDDSLGIREKLGDYYAIPAYPYHRPHREPEVLGYPVKDFASENKKITAILILQKADAHANIEIIKMKGIEKFKALREAVFIEFPFRKKEKFAFFSQMVQKTSIYTLTVPWDPERLNEVYERILSTSFE